MSEKADIKVLLVDDEETLLEYLSKRLLREGFIVKATFSGEEAVAVADENTFDAVKKNAALSPVHRAYRARGNRYGP